jgi:hypothetical protein
MTNLTAGDPKASASVGAPLASGGSGATLAARFDPKQQQVILHYAVL